MIGQEPIKLDEPKVLTDLPKTQARGPGAGRNNPDIVGATFDLYAARDGVDVAFSNLLPQPRSAGLGRVCRTSRRPAWNGRAPR